MACSWREQRTGPLASHHLVASCGRVTEPVTLVYGGISSEFVRHVLARQFAAASALPVLIFQLRMGYAPSDDNHLH